MWKNMTVYSLQQPLYKKEDQTGFSLRAMCRLSKCKTSAHYAGLLQHASTAKHKRNNSLFWWNFFPFIHSFSFCSPCQYFRNVCFWNAIKSHELIKWLSYIMVGNTTSSGGFFCCCLWRAKLRSFGLDSRGLVECFSCETWQHCWLFTK